MHAVSKRSLVRLRGEHVRDFFIRDDNFLDRITFVLEVTEVVIRIAREEDLCQDTVRPSLCDSWENTGKGSRGKELQEMPPVYKQFSFVRLWARRSRHSPAQQAETRVARGETLS
jgi:hypothetical protein